MKQSIPEIVKYYEKLTLKDYINDRVIEKIRLYYSLSRRNIIYYRIITIVTLLSGILAPIFYHFTLIDIANQKLIATTLSTIVVFGVSIESLFSFRETAKNYKNAENSLVNEYYLFQAKHEPYNKADNLLEVLVFRVESLILKERLNTIDKITEEINKKSQ